MNAEARAEHAADLTRILVDVHDRLAAGRIEQGVALAHRLAEPGADGEDEVGVADMRHQRRVGADAEVPHEVVQGAVVDGLAGEN